MARLCAGESVRQVALALDVAPSSVVKWSQRLRETGSCAPAGTGGHPPRKIVGAHEIWLLERIKEPFTLRVLVGELAERGLKVDYRTVWAFVHRTGYSFKKRPNSPRSRTAPT
jgi:putative transposase